jgi:hypothetical protein
MGNQPLGFSGPVSGWPAQLNADPLDRTVLADP